MLDDLAPVFRDTGVAVAYLFGSRAAGTERPGSDYDIAVLFDHDADWLEPPTVADALARRFGGTSVDVVDLERVNLELRGAVVQTGRLVYSVDEPRRVAFETRTRSEYFDYVPTMRSLTWSFTRRIADRGLA